MNKIDENNENLKHSGLRSTKQRTAILDILDNINQPIAAEDIYKQLKEKDISVNLSTVYRALETLTDKNLVTKISIIGDNRALFESNKKVHKHLLICIGCKKITAITHCPLAGYEKDLEQKTKFKISSHKLDVYGFCPECQEREH